MYLFKKRGFEALYFNGMIILKKTCEIFDNLVQKYCPHLSKLLVIFLILTQ